MTANVPAIAGIMTSGRLQQIADELGFTKCNEIYYVRYLIDEKVCKYNISIFVRNFGFGKNFGCLGAE